MSRRRKSKSKRSYPLLAYLAVAFVIVFVFTHYVMGFAIVEGNSMSPTLEDEDRVILTRLGLNETSLKRGDIIIFRSPSGYDDYIKRIIGVPGDYVEIIGGNLYLNGEFLEEDYTDSNFTETKGREDWLLGTGEFFVLGDNRDHSEDSRIYGPIPERDIEGKVLWHYSPIFR